MNDKENDVSVVIKVGFKAELETQDITNKAQTKSRSFQMIP